MALLLDEQFLVKPVGIDQRAGTVRVEYSRGCETVIEAVPLSRLSGATWFELDGRRYQLKVMGRC